MPTRSRNARTKARQKRSMSLLKRGLRETAFQANKNFSTVLMLLAQAGGEVMITTEVIRATVGMLQKASYVVENVEGGVVVKVVQAEADQTDQKAEAGLFPVATDDLSDLRTVDLEEIKARMNAAHNATDNRPVFVPGVNSVTAELQDMPAYDQSELPPVAEPTPVDPTIEANDPA